MNKKNVIILVVLFILAILFSIITLKVYSLKSVEGTTETSGKRVKDFIDIDNSKLDSYDYSDGLKGEEFHSTVQSNEKGKSNSEVSAKTSSTENTESSENKTVSTISETDEKTKEIDTMIESLGDAGDIPISEIYSPEVLNTVQELLNSTDVDYSDVKVASNEDITFLSNIISAADSYVLAYDEAQSFILTGDLGTLRGFVSKDFKETIKTFESIETYGNKDFENIKQIYLDGMNATVEGFNTYINNPSSEDCNKFFLEADDKFYEGQQELKKVLSEYMAD